MKIERNFDFLGYHFSPKGLTLAEITVRKFAKRLLVRLYESSSFRNKSKEENPIPEAVSLYVKRFTTWGYIEL